MPIGQRKPKMLFQAFSCDPSAASSGPLITWIAVRASGDRLTMSPKAGTVTADVAKAVKEIKAGKIEYRVDKTGIIHAGVGKISFGVEKLKENAKALIDAVQKAKPSAAKGKYVKAIHMASTMGPSITVSNTVVEK